MKTKYDGHDAGPWTLGKRIVLGGFSEKDYYEVRMPQSGPIHVHGFMDNPFMHKANALLATDSPKLLAALVKIVETQNALDDAASNGTQWAMLACQRALWDTIDEARKLIQEEAK